MSYTDDSARYWLLGGKKKLSMIVDYDKLRGEKENMKLASYLNKTLDDVEAGLQISKEIGWEDKMEIEVREKVSIEEGAHKGKIIKIEYRDDPYEYVDIFVQPENKEFEIKYGVPKYLSQDSKLGKLLALFGGNVKPKTKLDPEKILVNRDVKFIVMNEVKEDREYARIVDGSLKPI